MRFTDVEMAILSQCAYYGYPDSAEKQSLDVFLDNNIDRLKADLGDNYSKAITTLIVKVKDKDYTIVQTMNDREGTGFAAFAIRDPSNNVTVACRGTEGFSFDYDSRKDVYADVQLAYTLQTSQQEKMKEFVHQLQKGGYDNYYFTGHSLGGNLAMYGAICLDYPDKLGGVVTYNAPGFNSAFMVITAERLAEIRKKIISYQNECDGVSESFTVPGNIVVLECDGWDILNIDGVAGHDLKKLIVAEDGESFKKNWTGRKDSTIVGLVLDGVTGITDIGMLLVLPGIAIYDLYKWSTGKLEAWLLSISPGTSYSAKNPQISLDISKLRIYSQRIQSVNTRLSKLDDRIDSLYWRIGLLDLWNLMRSDFNISWSYRLSKCASYLGDTATDFENVEATIIKNL